VATFVAGVVTAVLGKVVAEWWTDRWREKRQRSAADKKFAQVVVAMPMLLQEMSADVRDKSLVRVLVPLPNSHIGFNYRRHTSGTTRRRIQTWPARSPCSSFGYIHVESGGDFQIDRMTEEFVTLLVERLPQLLPSA
jgi:hypothetical protein